MERERIDLLRNKIKEYNLQIRKNDFPREPKEPFKVSKPDGFIITRFFYLVCLCAVVFLAKFIFPLNTIIEYLVKRFNFSEINIMVILFLSCLMSQIFYCFKDYNKYKVKDKRYKDFLQKMKDFEVEKREYPKLVKKYNIIEIENIRIREKIKKLNNEIIELVKVSNPDFKALFESNSKEKSFKRGGYRELGYVYKEKTNDTMNNNINDKVYRDLFCPKCGYKFKFEYTDLGKISGGFGGIVSGALFGSKIGLAMGPLGAIAGTIPGAIIGGLFGKSIGNKFDKPICPKCSTSFDV